jgi:hypothetical protein
MRLLTVKTLTPFKLGFLGAVGLSLVTIGQAQAFSFNESSDAGFKPSNAADTTVYGAVGLSSTIEGLLPARDFVTGNDKNKADLFKILIDSDGLFTALTEGRDPNSPKKAPNPILDPILYLFDSDGRYITSDDDSGPARQSKLTQLLAAGTYYLGITKYGLTPNYTNGGVLKNWGGTIDAIGADSQVSAYRINLSHDATPVPTPAMLPGLVGMGLGLWRKRKALA